MNFLLHNFDLSNSANCFEASASNLSKIGLYIGFPLTYEILKVLSVISLCFNIDSLYSYDAHTFIRFSSL